MNSITKLESKSNLICFDKYHSKIKTNKQLRKFPGYFELCIINDYEIKYFDFNSEAIQIGNVFAVVINYRQKYLLASILFPSHFFDIAKINEWTKNYKILLVTDNDCTIKCADEIVEGLIINDYPLVLFQKGRNTLKFNAEKFINVEDNFSEYVQNVDMNNYIDCNNSDNHMSITYNNNIIDYLPKITLNNKMDKVICNGILINADYIDMYNGNVAFFSNNCCNPVAVISDCFNNIDITSHRDTNGSILYEFKLH